MQSQVRLPSLPPPVLVDVLCFTWYNIPQYYTQAELLKCTEAIFLSLILRAKLKKITQQKYSALLMTLKRYATNMRYTSSNFPSENSKVLCLGVFAAASISIMEVAGHTRQSMNSVLSISSPQQRHQSPLLTGSSYFMCRAKITPVKTQTQY